jgi:serine/threonine-protein kinase RsbW
MAPDAMLSHNFLYSDGNGVAADAAAIAVDVETRRPRIEMRLRSHRDVLPVVRQALRGVGESVDTPTAALQDAELAITEACANAVRHAYRAGGGPIEVTIEARPTELLAVVRDRGKGMRGTHGRRSPYRRGDGLGLSVIESVAKDVQIRSEVGVGTEVAMALHGPAPDAVDGAQIACLAAEHVVRRLVAMIAAQADLPPERITEALLASELVARHALSQLEGDVLCVRVERRVHGVDLWVGPLATDGAASVLERTGLPELGSVVERLADRVWKVPAPGARGSGEQLAVSFLG